MVSHDRQEREARTGRRLTGVVSEGWLSGILGKPAFRAAVDASDEALASLPSPSFAYARVDAADVRAAIRLQNAGFRVVDVSVGFARSSAAPSLPPPGARVARVTKAEEAAVLAVAGSCFRYSRFHLDPQVPEAVAHEIKRAWIENYLRGNRGDALYAAFDGSKAAGFLAVLISGRQALIDLIGVDAGSQGKGLGRALVHFFVNEYRGRVDELAVGTQAANIPSLRFYESCGFTIVKTALVLHKHS